MRDVFKKPSPESAAAATIANATAPTTRVERASGKEH
jgi:hypothetical protein